VVELSLLVFAPVLEQAEAVGNGLTMHEIAIVQPQVCDRSSRAVLNMTGKV
jgi:hypothetical protein